MKTRPWTNAPILVKGLMVVALPVLALAVSSALVLSTDSARAEAQRDRDATEAVDGAVNQVRASSTEAITDLSKYFIQHDSASMSALQADLGAWDTAMAAVETASRSDSEAVLTAEVRGLRATSDALYALVHRLSVATNPTDVNSLFTQAATTNTNFEQALGTVSARAETLSRAHLRDYERLSTRSTTLVLATGGFGVFGAIVAMVVFALGVRRQVRRLEANARALGQGQPLPEQEHARDELGHLGQRLDEAGALLRRRERDLHDSADAVRESEKKLALALESGAMGIWDVDLTTGRSVWDQQCEMDHGLATGAFGGTFEAWLALVHPDDRAEVLSSGNAAMSDGGRWTTTYRAVRPDGTVRWIGTSGRAVLDEEGKAVRLIGISTDITDRKRDEQSLRDAIEAADAANGAKSDFLSRVSHELRTPLNAILGFGQLLAMDDLEDGQRESVEQVLAAGHHLLALIDDVLAISRIESGNLTMSVEPVNLEEVLAETVALVSTMAQQNAVALRSEVGTCVGVHVSADRRQLKQILLNLASNAVKFNRPGGTVTFSCVRPTAGTVRVAVSDTGIGIPADRLDRLFTPFDRLGAEQLDIEGTGIGLALSKRLAELQSATLTVDSEEGKGSTFSLDLPVTVDPLANHDDPVAARAPTVVLGPVATVLYVEDNPSNLRLVQRVLDRRGGTRLLTAGTGAMALALAGEVPLDLILLDLHLPDMKGEDVLMRLRRQPATALTPVIVVSADASPGRIERLMDMGADGFLTKPIDLAGLMQVLNHRLMKASR